MLATPRPWKYNTFGRKPDRTPHGSGVSIPTKPGVSADSFRRSSGSGGARHQRRPTNGATDVLLADCGFNVNGLVHAMFARRAILAHARPMPSTHHDRQTGPPNYQLDHQTTNWTTKLDDQLDHSVSHQPNFCRPTPNDPTQTVHPNLYHMSSIPNTTGLQSRSEPFQNTSVRSETCGDQTKRGRLDVHPAIDVSIGHAGASVR